MGFFDLFKKRGFYEGGKVTQANKDFWNENATFEDNAKSDRDRMRARARWLSANNAIMDNIDNAIVNNVVGNGITFQSITGNSEFDLDLETRFNRWCNDPRLCDVKSQHTFMTMQRLMLKSRMVDGEVFLYLKYTKDGLKLQLIEADTLNGSHGTDTVNTSREDIGISVDAYGAPKMYHFIDENYKPVNIKAKYIINYFKPERPSQYRGVSEYKQAIVDLKNFSAFQSASIQGARARANIAYVVKNDGTSGDPYGADLQNKIQNINGVSVLYMETGETVDKLDPDSVATDYTQFSENTIRLIATARKISYELAFRDYSKVNFASSRASLLQDFKLFDFEQSHLVQYVLDRVLEAWLDNEVLRGTFRLPDYETKPYLWLKPKWIMPKRDLVDPLKEITAIEKKIRMNLTCETDVANSNGEDYEGILAKKAKEIELKTKYGIPDYTLIEDSTESGDVDFDENITGAEKANDVKD